MPQYITKTAAKKIIDDWYKQTETCLKEPVTNRICDKCDFGVYIPHVLSTEQVILIPTCELFHKIFSVEVN